MFLPVATTRLMLVKVCLYLVGSKTQREQMVMQAYRSLGITNQRLLSAIALPTVIHLVRPTSNAQLAQLHQLGPFTQKFLRRFATLRQPVRSTLMTST